MADGDNLLGDGVNIAARLEALAPPDGICISKSVADLGAGKVDATFANAGSHEMKNITTTVEVWTRPPELAKKPTDDRKSGIGRRVWQALRQPPHWHSISHSASGLHPTCQLAPGSS